MSDKPTTGEIEKVIRWLNKYHIAHENVESDKPTTDAHRLFEPEDEPNIISRSTPTSGEWTVERINRYRNKAWLAEDFNTALAAEREKFTEAADYNERLSKVCDNLRVEAKQNWKLIDQLRKQLARRGGIRQ